MLVVRTWPTRTQLANVAVVVSDLVARCAARNANEMRSSGFAALVEVGADMAEGSGEVVDCGDQPGGRRLAVANQVGGAPGQCRRVADDEVEAVRCGAAGGHVVVAEPRERGEAHRGLGVVDRVEERGRLGLEPADVPQGLLGDLEVGGLQGDGDLLEDVPDRCEEFLAGPSRRAARVVRQHGVDHQRDCAADQRIDEPGGSLGCASRLGDGDDECGDGGLVDEQGPAADRHRGRGGEQGDDPQPQRTETEHVDDQAGHDEPDDDPPDELHGPPSTLPEGDAERHHRGDRGEDGVIVGEQQRGQGERHRRCDRDLQQRPCVPAKTLDC